MKNQMNKSIIPQGFIAQTPKSVHPSSPPPIYDAPVAGPVAAVAPTHEDIARRAYEIYVQKGRLQGQSEQNWRQAEWEQLNRGLATFLPKVMQT
jgi:hypothetical protein